jgi:probable phosphoglycerate mutase
VALVNTVLWVRHGETFWNRERRIQGRTGSDLTPLGARQADAVGALVASWVRDDPRPWRLVASPLARAQRTAQAVARATGLPVETDDLLAEVCCGAWEGRLSADIAREDPARHAAGAGFFGAPGGETFEQVMDRVTSWLARLEPGRPVVAVGHGVWGRLLRGAYLGLDREATLALEIPQDAVFRLEAGRAERLDAEVPPA